MKKISLLLMLIVTGWLSLSAQTEQVVPEQLQAKPLTGYIQIGQVDVNGWFTVEYVGNENVNMSATVNGSSASIINGRIKLPDYGTYVVIVTAKAQGYATLTVTFDDVVWEPDEHNHGFWIVFVDRYNGNKTWIKLLNGGNRFYNTIDIYRTHEVDHERIFYFVIDGINYGAYDDWTELALIGWELNPLMASSENLYYVPTGYSYLLGVKIYHDPYTMEVVGYFAFGERYAELPSGVFGDVNGDYYVSITDVTALIDYLLGVGSNIIGRNSDLNYDGAVNIADVSALIDMLLH